MALLTDNPHLGHDMPGHDMPGHGGSPSPDRCSMNMLFTWDWKNTCVVFKWWHIRTFQDFVLTFIAIVVLTAGYEWLRTFVATWDARSRTNIIGTGERTVNKYRMTRGIFYGLQVGASFWLMLVFMTYNGWLMIAVVLGAAIGNYLWGDSGERHLACH